MVDISEKNFEATIEATLLAGGPDAAPGDAIREPRTMGFVPGGYRKRKPEEYDKSLMLIRRDAYDFVIATQPKPLIRSFVKAFVELSRSRVYFWLKTSLSEECYARHTYAH